VGEVCVRNGEVLKHIYREGGSKRFQGSNAVQKRVKTRFFDLTTIQNV